MTDSTKSWNMLVSGIKAFLKDRFNLSEGKASEKQTIEEIQQGVAFRGANLWILIFATMVAAVGLNVNSTAVVIGAMLISPLMGPIMGIGLGVGINDFELILKGLKNLGIAVLISVITSALYFWISPLNDAQSELLARTSPTLWDVLIASFGGLAGIVAGSRKEKSNAIPGVAIATALMPPLCTAGYGLATSQWTYFFGAFYLFFINSVFISLSTYLIVKVLRFRQKEFLDPEREKRVKRSIMIFAILTIMPSIWTGVKVVRESIFTRNAQTFINTEMEFPNTQVINRKIEYNPDGGLIQVTLYGAPISVDLEHSLRSKLDDYGLHNCSLDILQGYQDESIDRATVEQMNLQLRTGIIEELYEKNEEQIRSRDDRIKLLENEIISYKSQLLPIADYSQEIKAFNQNLEEFTITPSVISQVDSMTMDTTYLAYARFKRAPRRSELTELQTWLIARTKAEKIRLVVD